MEKTRIDSRNTKVAAADRDRRDLGCHRRPGQDEALSRRTTGSILSSDENNERRATTTSEINRHGIGAWAISPCDAPGSSPA
jgi:hypothetical protein